MLKVEEISVNEHQKEKFLIIQSKINEINQKRLKLDQEIKKKWIFRIIINFHHNLQII